jgi:hypothetical protein
MRRSLAVREPLGKARKAVARKTQSDADLSLFAIFVCASQQNRQLRIVRRYMPIMKRREHATAGWDDPFFI